MVVGRVIAASGESIDLFAGQSASLAGGPPTLRQQIAGASEPAAAESPPDGATQVEATADGLSLKDGQPNGAESRPDSGRKLATGDVVEARGARYVVIVR